MMFVPDLDYGRDLDLAILSLLKIGFHPSDNPIQRLFLTLFYLYIIHFNTGKNISPPRYEERGEIFL